MNLDELCFSLLQKAMSGSAAVAIWHFSADSALCGVLEHGFAPQMSNMQLVLLSFYVDDHSMCLVLLLFLSGPL